MKLLKDLRRSESVFVKDDDSHDYLIPLDQQDKFDEWNEAMTDYWNNMGDKTEDVEFSDLYSGPDFAQYMIGMHPNAWEFPPEEDLLARINKEAGTKFASIERLIEGMRWMKEHYSEIVEAYERDNAANE